MKCESPFLRTFRLVLIAVSVVALAGCAHRCPTGRASDSLRVAVDHLRGYASDGKDDITVPPHVQEMIRQVKRELRLAVTEFIRDPELQGISPARLRTEFLRRAAGRGVRIDVVTPDNNNVVPSDQEVVMREHPYRVVDLDFQRLAGRDDLMAVATYLGIPYGSDGSLYVFRKDSAGGNPVFAHEVNGYTEISGANGYFGYATSSPGANGEFLVATVRATPWPTSNWQGLGVRIFRITPGPPGQREIFRHEDVAFLGEDNAYTLAAIDNGFSIRFLGSQGLDAGILIRDYVLTYKISGNSVSRVSPVALRPEDFVDEWIQRPWDEASKWNSPESDFQQWHGILAKDKGLENSAPGLRFVQPCDRSHWQVGLAFEPPTEGPPLPKELLESMVYFSVEKKGNGDFMLRGIDTIRPPGCPGEAPPMEWSK